VKEALPANRANAVWVKGGMVLRTKQELPGDFVSIHAHAAEAQADAHRREPGHQVFHGSHRTGSDEFLIDQAGRAESNPALTGPGLPGQKRQNPHKAGFESAAELAFGFLILVGPE
jgi:hypothetical protein